MIRQLVTIPDAVLRLKSKRIGLVDEAIKELAADMIATTLDWDHDSEFGAALAAIQVGNPIKLTVIRNNFDDASDKSFVSFINPKVLQVSRQRVVDIEGCLSVPGYYARIPRPKSIKISAETLDGDPIKLNLEGFAARVFMHEIDHMQGKLFVDYINGPDDVLELDSEGKLQPVTVIPDVIRNFRANHQPNANN